MNLNIWDQHPLPISNKNYLTSLNQNWSENECVSDDSIDTDLEFSQGFYLKNKEHIIIPPNTEYVIDSIIFAPSVAGKYNLTLIIGNNYTVFEEISIYGEALISKISIHEKICFDKSKNHIENQAPLEKAFLNLSYLDIVNDRDNLIFSKIFELRNYGNYTANLKGLFLDGDMCSINGLEIRPCKEEKIINPGQSIEINIIYTPYYNQYSLKHDVWINMDKEIFIFPIEISISDNVLKNYKVFNLNTKLSNVLLLAFEAISLSVLLIAFIIICEYRTRKRNDISNSRGITIIYIKRYLPIKYEQPVFKSLFTNIARKISVDSPRYQDEISPSSKMNEIKFKEAFKDRFGFNKFEDNINSSFSQIIATNQLLNSRKTPLGGSSESVSNTSPNKSEEDDFFIDSYKMNNVLFSGMAVNSETAWEFEPDFDSELEN